MGKWKVFYFKARARAEIIRLTLRAAKIEFDDIRFEREEWPEYKKKSPTGQAPWAETADGRVLTQSMAIARMVAREHGMLGKSPEDTYLIERSIDQMNDLKEEMYKFFFTEGAEEKEKKRKEIIEGRGETILSLIDKNLDEGEGLLCKGQVTLADLCLLLLVDYLREMMPELMEKHPKLTTHYDHISKAVPEVGDWIANRPQTAM